MKPSTALLSAFVLVAAACGGGSDDAEVISGTSAAGVDVDVEDLIEDPEGFVEDIAEGLGELQNSQGGGSATFVAGDQRWEFSSVLCAFGPDEIGQDGAEFVLSSIQDGLQMYVSVDSFGDSISLNDVTDFVNPSVDLGTFGTASITLEGKNVTATGDFVDGTAEDFTTIPGTFEASCP